MDIVARLREKKIKVKEIPGWGSYLRKQWEENFAGDLSYEEKEAIFLYEDGGFSGYLWHIFSYEKIDCVKDVRANQAFNNVTKNTCYVFHQNSDYALIIEDASLVIASEFMKKDDFDEGDIYVVDQDFTWTYVNTHEGSCGPYFSLKSD